MSVRIVVKITVLNGTYINNVGATTMETKYDVAAQKEWLHEATDWETKRAEEFAPSVGFSLFVIFFALMGLRVLNGIADWAVGL